MNDEAAAGDYGRFLGAVRAALGWDRPAEGLAPQDEEAAVLGEIERLRDSAGEAVNPFPLPELEVLLVAQVHPVGGNAPGIILITRAGSHETHHQGLGRPWSSSIVEQPERHLAFIMTNDQARETIEMLSRYLDPDGEL